jgi:hypothetical protein
MIDINSSLYNAGTGINRNDPTVKSIMYYVNS